MNIRPERWILGGTLVAAAALCWLSIWPNWHEAGDREARADGLAEKVGSLDEAQHALAQATDRLSQARTRQEDACLDVPATADVAGLMQSLSLDVDGRHVRDQTFTVVDRPASETDRFQALPLRVEMESDFQSVWEVLERIERLPRLVRVAGLEITAVDPEDPGESDPALQAALSLDVIYVTTQGTDP